MARAAKNDRPTKAPARPTTAKKDTGKKEKKRRVRGAIGRLTMRSSFLRRRYVRRVLKSIDKAKAKGRRLPPELFELSQQLSRVPKNKQAEALEEAIKAGPDAAEEAGRAMRRAAAAQQRQSGRGQGRYRPGMPPPPPGQRRPRPR
jgi:hypothetical protein